MNTHKHRGARALQWALVASCLAAGGCVVVEEPARAEQSRDDAVYRTGSRLPSRDGSPGSTTVRTVNKDDWDVINRSRPASGPLPGSGQ